jgi:uncharacterized membrane protein HdeD (DUF308 family)
MITPNWRAAQMIRTLINNWWLLALRGVLAALFSVIAFMVRSSAESFTLREFATKGIIVLLGILALAAGAATIATGVWRAHDRKSWLVLLDGLGIGAAGLVFIFTDAIGFRLAMSLLALVAVAVGVVELATARRLRRHVSDEWFLGLSGLASLGCGLGFLMIGPNQPGSIFVWLGVYSGLSSLCILGLVLRLRGLRASVHQLASGSVRTNEI